MDKTEKYVFMCDIIEIQKHCKFNSGDHFYGYCTNNCGETVSDKKEMFELNWYEDYWYENIPKGYNEHKKAVDQKVDAIWLPNIDKLQELAFPQGTSIIKIINELYFFTYNNIRESRISYISKFVTMEQLLLVFIMEKNYNKYWNNMQTKWLEIEKET